MNLPRHFFKIGIIFIMVCFVYSVQSEAQDGIKIVRTLVYHVIEKFQEGDVFDTKMSADGSKIFFADYATKIYAINFDGTDQKTIYVSGDTRHHIDLAKEVKACAGADIDLVLICINGRMNNMGVDEAVKVVNQLQPRVASPMHYGLFAENTVDPEPFAHKCHSLGIRSFVFPIGKPINLDKLLSGVENEDS